MFSDGIVYVQGDMRNIGAGSPDTWSEYDRIEPNFREVIEKLYTPKAYKALHYHPNTFKRIFELPGMTFDKLEIFKLEDKNFALKTSESSRSPYLIIFETARHMIKSIHRSMLQNIVARQVDDVSIFVNMSFACETSIEWTPEPIGRSMSGTFFKQTTLKGFFPYFSNLSADLDEIMFFFTYANTDRIVLVTAPNHERKMAIEFVRKQGVMQFFDKVCAQCGKTGNLDKCPCKAVRYCCTECHRAHWPLHKVDCEWVCKKHQRE